MLSQKMLLRSMNSYKKIELSLKLSKKKKKYCNAVYDYTLRPEKLISNGALFILLKLKKVEILQIVIVFPNYIIYRVTECFSDISYWSLSLPPLLAIAIKQYKSSIISLLYALLPKSNKI